MACKRLFGFHSIRCTKDVRYLHPCFTVPSKDRIRRSPDHLANATGYPDPDYYLNEVQYYVFRNKDLADLRLEQFFRYFSHGLVEDARDRAPVAQRTHEETLLEDSDV